MSDTLGTGTSAKLGTASTSCPEPRTGAGGDVPARPRRPPDPGGSSRVGSGAGRGGCSGRGGTDQHCPAQSRGAGGTQAAPGPAEPRSFPTPT